MAIVFVLLVLVVLVTANWYLWRRLFRDTSSTTFASVSRARSERRDRVRGNLMRARIRRPAGW